MNNRQIILVLVIVVLTLMISGYYITQHGYGSSSPETGSTSHDIQTMSKTDYTYASSTYVTISVHDAHQLIEMTSENELIILDVRTIEEYTRESIEGAMNIPLQELQEKVGMIDKNKIIIVYCRSGVRSLQASQILVDNGFTRINNMEGGIIAWHNEGYPLLQTEENNDCGCPD